MTIDRDPFDPAIDALLRAHSNATPPEDLDAAILAAAHRAVGGGWRSARVFAGSRPWRRWLPLAATATIGAAAFGVLQVAPRDTRVESPAVSDMPEAAPAPADSRAARDAAAINSDAPPGKTMQLARPAAPPASAQAASAKRDTAARDGRAAGAQREAAAPVERAAGAQRETAMPERPADALRERTSAPQPFPLQKKQAADAPAPSARPAELPTSRGESAGAAAGALRADQASDAETRSVTEWIARIRTLRDEGKPAEAEKALAQFRLTYTDADARLPDDLRAWAGTTKR